MPIQLIFGDLKVSDFMQNVKGKTGLFIGAELSEFMSINPDLSVGELAKSLGVTQSLISKWKSNVAPIQLRYVEPLFTRTTGYTGAAKLVVSIVNEMSFGLIPKLPQPQFVDYNLNALAQRSRDEINGYINALSNVTDEYQNPDAPNHVESLKDVEAVEKQVVDLLRSALTLFIQTADRFHLDPAEISRERQHELLMAHEQVM